MAIRGLTSRHSVTHLKALRNVKFVESTFRDQLESTPDAIVIIGPDGRIELVNSLTEALFGYKREELLGELVEILVPQRFHGKHPGHRTSFFAQPRGRAMGLGLELNARRKDGTELRVEISLSPLDTTAGLFVFSAIRDVTDRKRVKNA